jgi:hypothetical protein
MLAHANHNQVNQAMCDFLDLELGTNVLQFDDLIWDQFEESTDDMVQEPYEDDEHTPWATENDARRIFNRSHHLFF